MKQLLFIITLGVGTILYASEQDNLRFLNEINVCVKEKCGFVEQHDGLNLLPRIATICNQLQQACRESQTICKERRFALDRELAILVQLYLKQLPEDEIAQLKNIIKKYHDLQRQIFADPAVHKQFSQRQKHYIELIFI
jgi:hypothetical protein